MSQLAMAVAVASISTLALAASSQELPSLTVFGQQGSNLGDSLLREQARDIRDVLDRDANIDIGGGVRQGQRLYLRGIEGSNVNVTLDGARQGQNLYNHRGGLGNIDPDILKRVEVRPGPAAADDGPGAIGGSIRMETVDAQDLLTAGQSVGARLRAGYASANRSERGSASVYGVLGPGIGLLGHISRDDYDDLRVGGGKRTPFSGGRDESYLLKLSLLDLGDHQLRIGAERHEASGLNYQQRGDYPWQFQPDFEARPPRDQRQTREQQTLNYRFNPASNLVDTELSLYQAETVWKGMTGPPNNLVERFTSKGWGGDLRNRLHYQNDAVQGTLTLGMDYFEDEGINGRSDRPNRRNQNENLGLYLQNRFATQRWDLSFGVRHDDFEVSYRDGTTKASNTATSLNLSGAWHFQHGISAFAGYGEAASGAGTIPVHFAGNVIEDAGINGVPGGRLKAERSRQTEMGVRWEDNTSGVQRRVEALAFQNRISDAILFDQPGSGGLGGRPVTDIYNADKTATFKGYELRAGYGFGRLRTDVSFMHLDTSGLPPQPQFLVRFGAPQGDRVALHLNYALTPELDLGYSMTAVARLKDVPDDQEVFIKKSGYAVHDAFLNWQPQAWSNLSVDLSARNLLDKRYSRHTTLSQGGLSTLDPGRDLRVGLRYVF